jgi:FkbM family methyltransferase
LIKKIALKVLRKFPFDFSIKNHWVPSYRLHLSSFQHKNYWWHGKKREQGEMIEVGGHIGYLAQLFRSCVGKEGSVYVFEPGLNNFRYLQKNTALFENIFIRSEAVADRVGEMDFYVEDLSGQNNSLIEDFKILEANSNVAGIQPIRSVMRVSVTTIDTFVEEGSIIPDFIKIDVEGAEHLVVSGASKVLREIRPIVMIEVTSNTDEVYQTFLSHDYVITDHSLAPISFGDNRTLNWFCIPKERRDLVDGRSIT